MKHTKFLISTLLIFMMFVSMNNPVMADGLQANKNGGVTTLTTDSIVVEIKGEGNIPAFFFWSPADVNTTYRLQLDQVFESIDSDSDGAYDPLVDTKVPNSNIGLASYNWAFSEFEVLTNENQETTGINFNITSTNPVGNYTSDLYIQFRIHLDAANVSQVKFDVVVDGYTFKNPDAIFVVGFKLTTTKDEAMNQIQTRSQIRFGKGYFESNDTADDNNGQIQVRLSYSDKDGDVKVFLSYEHFDGMLVHDPIIGIQSDIAGGDDSSTDQNTVVPNVPKFTLPVLSKAALISTGVIATIAFLMLPVLVYKMKKH